MILEPLTQTIEIQIWVFIWLVTYSVIGTIWVLKWIITRSCWFSQRLTNQIHTFYLLLLDKVFHADASFLSKDSTRTTLHYCGMGSRFAELKLLLDCSTDREALLLTPDNNGITLLHEAVKEGDMKIIRLLLHYLSPKDFDYLLSYNVTIGDASDNDVHTTHQKMIEIVKEYVLGSREYNEEFTFMPDDYKRLGKAELDAYALYKAMEDDNLQAIKRYLEVSLDKDALLMSEVQSKRYDETYEKWIPLVSFVRGQALKVVLPYASWRALLIHDAYGETLLSRANAVEVRLLLEQCLDKQALLLTKNDMGDTPLHCTAKSYVLYVQGDGEKERAKAEMLLHYASDKDALLLARDKEGRTPMHRAVENDKRFYYIMVKEDKLVKLFIDSSADKKSLLLAKDTNGWTPLHVAAKSERKVVDTLFQYLSQNDMSILLRSLEFFDTSTDEALKKAHQNLIEKLSKGLVTSVPMSTDASMCTLQAAASASEAARGRGQKRQQQSDDGQAKRTKNTPQDEEMSVPTSAGLADEG